MTTVPNINDRLARLEAEAGVERDREFPASWDRDEEPRLFGTLVQEREISTKYGPRLKATVQRPDGSTIDVWITPRRLRDEWQMAAPEVGDVVLISYHGGIDVGKGNPMADIRVRVDRGPQLEVGEEPNTDADIPF